MWMRIRELRIADVVAGVILSILAVSPQGEQSIDKGW